MTQETMDEVLANIPVNEEEHRRFFTVSEIKVALEAWASLKVSEATAPLLERVKEANEFICDIAKLLGEDNLGLDGCQWSIDDFKTAIQSLTTLPEDKDFSDFYEKLWRSQMEANLKLNDELNKLQDKTQAAKLALEEIRKGTDFPLSIAQNALQILNKE